MKKKLLLLLFLIPLCLAGVAQYAPRLLALTQVAIIDYPAIKKRPE